jgi:hypothetical protein
MDLDVTPGTLRVGHPGHPPVVQRHFSGVTNPAAGVDSWKTEDGSVLLLRVPKAQHGQKWRRLFKVGSGGVGSLHGIGVNRQLSGTAQGLEILMTRCLLVSKYTVNNS